MNASYESRLGHELTAVGVTGALRRRILAEFADHLACDHDAPDHDARLGDPAALARQFADELGTERAMKAAVWTFAALAAAGVLFAIAFLTSGSGAFGAYPKGAPPIGRVATGFAFLGPQIAFVAGSLAVLRWLARHRRVVVPGAEATIIVRRAAVGIFGGMLTMVSLGGIALAYRPYVSAAWDSFALAVAGCGTAALLAAAAPVWAAARLRPRAGGSAGDIFDDLGPMVPARLRGHPWRLATIVAAAVAVAITLAGVPADDAIDGAVRGIADALACLVGFATLGRYLGLWSRPSDGDAELAA